MKYLSVKSLSGAALAAMAGSLVLLVLMWHLTTPLSGGPLAILVVFVLIYIFFTSVFLIVTGIGSAIAARLRGRTGLHGRRRYYVSSVLGLLPVLLLTLLSMGGASAWGLILIVLFVGLMLFYVLRRAE